MKAIIAAVREVLGLFVDDGSLAAALIVWIIVIALAVRGLGLDRAWGAPILAIGCLAILLVNLRSAAR